MGQGITILARGSAAGMALAILMNPAAALAQTIGITAPYGNEAGCKVVKEQAPQSQEALVVRDDRFESAGSVCEFVQVLQSKKGAKVVTALCDIDGEDGQSVNLFSITPSKTDPTALAIRDEYGAAWDEVKPCG